MRLGTIAAIVAVLAAGCLRPGGGTASGLGQSSTPPGPPSLSASPPASAPNNLPGMTVGQAVERALASAPAVAQAQHQLEAADARLSLSRMPRYPDLAFSGAYTRIGPVPEIEFGSGTLELAPTNNYDVRLGLRQTLCDFGRTGAAIDLAQAGRQSAADYVDLVKWGLAYRTIAAFNSIMILREHVAVIDDQIEALNQHLEVSRKKAQAGTATDFDVLTTKVRAAAATNDRIDAASNLETQEIAFRELVGLAQGSPVNISGDFARTERGIDPASLLAMALAERPEMVAARDAELSAGLAVRLVSLGDRPTLALNLASGFTTGYPDNLNQLKANYAAGLDVRVPIFNGHRARNQRHEAEAGLRSAQARTEDLRRQITTEVEQAVARAGASWQKTGNAEVLVKQAEDAVAMARTKYDAGVATNLDLLDAQTTLTQAKMGYLRSLYAYTMSLVELDRATGRRVWQ